MGLRRAAAQHLRGAAGLDQHHGVPHHPDQPASGTAGGDHPAPAGTHTLPGIRPRRRDHRDRLRAHPAATRAAAAGTAGADDEACLTNPVQVQYYQYALSLAGCLTTPENSPPLSAARRRLVQIFGGEWIGNSYYPEDQRVICAKLNHVFIAPRVTWTGNS